jgi:hypothetical protein
LHLFRHLARKFLAGRQPSKEFSYNLTKNLTGQTCLTVSILHHQLCAVLPKKAIAGNFHK